MHMQSKTHALHVRVLGKITPAFQAAIDKADALSAGVHNNQQGPGFHAMARDA